jgi:Tol biopolymer transport system component
MLTRLVLTLVVAVLAGGWALTAVAEDEPLLSSVRQLVFEGKRSGEGYFNRDGRLLIFQSERESGNPFYQMYVLDLESGDTRRVSPGVGKTTCGWIHPDGTRVLYASTHEDPAARAKQEEELARRAAGTAGRYEWSFDEHYDLYEADPDGRMIGNLTRAPGYDAEGSWSPDGRTIVFASNRHAYTGELSPEDRQRLARDPSYFMDLYAMDADGSRVRRLTSEPGYDGGPFFSPDGRRVVWRHFAPDGATAEIWTMDLDGGGRRQVTRMGVMSWAPFYHPSGEYIVFASNLEGMANFELYLVDVDGRREPVRVTYTDGFDGLPVFSPDGGRIAWASKRSADRTAQIFLADWSHARALELLARSPPVDSGAPAAPTGVPPADTPGTASSRPAAAPPTAAGPTAPAPPGCEPRHSVATPGPCTVYLAGTSPAIAPGDLHRHVEYLASEPLGGRLTGTAGERAATEYVAAVFRALGLEPAGEEDSYFQPYEFTAGVSLAAGNRMGVAIGAERSELEVDRDWRPLAFSGSVEVDPAEVAFVGYGLVAAGNGEIPDYDAYGEVDVRDRWVMLFRYLPEGLPAAHRQHLAGHLELRAKAMLARERGAKGVLVVSGPNAGVKDPLVGLKLDTTLAGTSLAVVSITDTVAERLLAPAGRSLKGLQDALDAGETVPAFVLPGVRVAASVRVAHERRTARNVLARLPAGPTPGDSLVILGAHVDHIGDGVGFDSLADAEEQGQPHLGADDNASGVAGMLEIAQHLAAERAAGRLVLKRDILFAAWTGEEMGLLGSGHFVRRFAAARADPSSLSPAIAAYLNLDMVGRLDRQLYLQGVGSSPAWKGEIERRNVPVGLPVVTRDDSYLPTDATSFYLKGVPILSAFTGVHAEYNTPRDAPETLDYEGLARIARLMEGLTLAIARRDEAPEYVALPRPQAGASRRNLRAYLGTIPEYGETAVRGVRLNGVAKGAPAEAAGLRAGDVIVELAGRPLENVYDYTYALNALRVGEPVAVVVERNGSRVTLQVTPAARE